MQILSQTGVGPTFVHRFGPSAPTPRGVCEAQPTKKWVEAGFLHLFSGPGGLRRFVGVRGGFRGCEKISYLFSVQ